MLQAHARAHYRLLHPRLPRSPLRQQLPFLHHLPQRCKHTPLHPQINTPDSIQIFKTRTMASSMCASLAARSASSLASSATWPSAARAAQRCKFDHQPWPSKHFFSKGPNSSIHIPGRLKDRATCTTACRCKPC